MFSTVSSQIGREKSENNGFLIKYEFKNNFNSLETMIFEYLMVKIPLIMSYVEIFDL